VYRHFPLTQLHANAQAAAQAAQAAALQGKFWQMHDLLFENQNKWSGQSNAGARGTFETYAAGLGLDMEKFKRDRDSSAVTAKIQTDLESGAASGVTGTPTFYVNGKQMPHPQSYEQFKQAVVSALPQ